LSYIVESDYDPEEDTDDFVELEAVKKVIKKD